VAYFFRDRNVHIFVSNCFHQNSVFFSDKRDVYLAFKALNVSETGFLCEEEFMEVYSVTRLHWKVSYNTAIFG